MSERFNERDATALLVACHRRCCICHRWCGAKMELDHMVPVLEGGPSTIDNAIAVCFDCHAESHAYNPNHPRGRKMKAAELAGHKEQWLRICATRPDVFTEVGRTAEVGPIQALIDELEFNIAVAEVADEGNVGAPFCDEQFRRATALGSLSLLEEGLKKAILKAYVAIAAANQVHAKVAATSDPWAPNVLFAAHASQNALPVIVAAHAALISLLAPEG